MALVRLRDSSSFTSPGSVLYLRGTRGCTGTRLSLVSLASPAEGGEPVEEVEAERDDVDGDEDEEPERVLERLQERHQLRRPGLLKYQSERNASYPLENDTYDNDFLQWIDSVVRAH